LFSNLKDALKRSKDEDARRRGSSWLLRNWARVKILFENEALAKYVFEPVAELWDQSHPSNDAAISRLISQIAIANAVIAGLPGKLGIGVAVAIALEIYMAIQIARRTGVEINGIGDAMKYMGAGAAVALTVFEGFRQVLGFFFSLFSMVGFLPATANGRAIRDQSCRCRLLDRVRRGSRVAAIRNSEAPAQDRLVPNPRSREISVTASFAAASHPKPTRRPANACGIG